MGSDDSAISGVNIEGNLSMGIRKNITKGAGFVFRPGQWLGLDSLKQHGNLIGRIFKHMLHPKKDKAVEGLSFAQCMAHYGVSKEDLEKRKKSALQTVWFCCILASLCLLYAIYLFVETGFMSGLVTLSLGFVLSAYAFREHFNYFQMCRHRLGCTLTEWWLFVKKGGKA